MINWNIAKNPLNYAVVATMAYIGFLAISFVTAPLRADQPAQ